MRGNIHIFNSLSVLAQIADKVEHLLRRGIPHGVWDIQNCCARLNCRFAACDEKAPLRARSVLARKLNVLAVGLRVGDVLCNALQNLFAGHFQLKLHVYVTGCEEDVNARVLRAFYGIPCGINISRCAAGETGYLAVLYSLGYCFNAFEVLRRGDCKAGFYDINTQRVKLPCHLQLFRKVHAAAGGLLAVAQGCVKHLDFFHFYYSSSCCFAKIDTKKAPSSIEDEAANSAVPLQLTENCPLSTSQTKYCLFGNGEETRSHLRPIGFQLTAQG